MYERADPTLWVLKLIEHGGPLDEKEHKTIDAKLGTKVNIYLQ